MIVVDCSAILAILFREPERASFMAALAQSERSCMSAINVYEATVVLRRRTGIPAIDVIAQFLMRNRIEIVPFDEAAARVAAAAYDRYGRGIDSKARLNLADCAAYGLAKFLDAPLLFKGQDFVHTDIRACV